MLATLLLQWSRRYLRITQPPRCEPHKRARARAFFAIGVEKFHVPWAVNALPAMVHLSLFIFFAGLLVYLFNIHHTVFKVVVCWVALLTTVYAFITFMPFFWHDSPYYSPLSTTIWFLSGILPYAVLKVPHIIARLFSFRVESSIFRLRERCRTWGFEGLEAAAKEAMSKRLSEIDGHVLDWTADALGEDGAFEKFIETIPGFYQSDEVKDIPESADWSILSPLRGFLFRTLSSNSISGSVKTRRLALCFDAANQLRSSALEDTFEHLIHINWSTADSVEIGYFLRSLDKSSKGWLTPIIPGIIAHIVARVWEDDDRWTALALEHLDIPKSVLREYLTQGDSLLLANLIQFTRHTNRSHSFALDAVLAGLYEFDICNTLTELQHDFCAVWNEVVREAQNGRLNSCPVHILNALRHHYIALHRGTDAAPTAFAEDTNGFNPFDPILRKPSSYPLCNIPSHHSRPTHHVHDVAVAEAVPPPAATSFSVPRDSVLTAIAPPLPDDITAHPTDKPSLHILLTLLVLSYYPAPQVPQPNPSPTIPSDSAVMSTPTAPLSVITPATSIPQVTSLLSARGLITAIHYSPDYLPPSTQAATLSAVSPATSIPQMTSPPSARSLIAAPHHSPDYLSPSPLTVLVVSLSSSLSSLLSNMSTFVSLSSPTSSMSQSNQSSPGQEVPLVESGASGRMGR